MVTGPVPEDCLFLNVYTPDPVPAAPMPVLVWFHGGDYSGGFASSGWHDGRPLAERGGIIVVTIAWRLGVLGFLSHPALGAASGNYGFLDQQAALRWIRDNIAAFGGDPDAVTLYGAGVAWSVGVHLASPASAGLFHRAAIESALDLGGVDLHANQGTKFWQTQAQADVQGGRLAAAVGCATAGDVTACLRSKTPDELRTALPPFELFTAQGEAWGPHSGTPEIPTRPADAFEAGTFNKVPVILATTRDEASFIERYSQGVTEADYVLWTQWIWGVNADAVLARYPASAYASPAHAPECHHPGDYVRVGRIRQPCRRV